MTMDDSMKNIVVMLALILLAGLSGCSVDIYRKNYEIIVEYEVDGEVKTASSVLEFHARRMYPTIFIGYGNVGVAPIMALGQHGDMAFALTSYGRYEAKSKYINGHKCWGGAGADMPLYAYGILGFKEYPEHKDAAQAYEVKRLSKKSGRVKVPIERWNKFLWRPPGTYSESDFKFLKVCDFQFYFGDAVRILRITLEPTDKPLVTRIQNAPEWIVDWKAEIEAHRMREGTGGRRAVRRIYTNAIEQRTQREVQEDRKKFLKKLREKK